MIQTRRATFGVATRQVKARGCLSRMRRTRSAGGTTIAPNGLFATAFDERRRYHLDEPSPPSGVLRDTLAVVITALVVVDVTATNYARARRAIYNTLRATGNWRRGFRRGLTSLLPAPVSLSSSSLHRDSGVPFLTRSFSLCLSFSLCPIRVVTRSRN